jgi:hypothetical protein
VNFNMTAQATERTFDHDVRRFLWDMLAGAGLFALAGMLLMTDASAAQSVQSHEFGMGRLLPFSLLAFVFSGLLAFNLAFFRHLRRAYAPDRRSVKGSGPKN